MDTNDLKFTVCMGVYIKDNPTYFIDAVRSISTRQTVKPAEIIIVVDGPLTSQLENALSKLSEEIPNLKIIRYDQNQGHAKVRQTGLEASSHDLIAIMDSDDLSMPDRFERQIRVFKRFPETAIVGGQIKEFVNSTDNVVGERCVPLIDHDIKQYLKSRCPMNLVTVMYRKSAVTAVGGFEDWYCEEDYYLWIRLALNGYKFYNIDENLVNVRVGTDMYRRRGGWRYFLSEARLQKYMFNHKIISLPRLGYNVFGRFIIQVAMPNKFRGFIFQKLFRK